MAERDNNTEEPSSLDLFLNRYKAYNEMAKIGDRMARDPRTDVSNEGRKNADKTLWGLMKADNDPVVANASKASDVSNAEMTNAANRYGLRFRNESADVLYKNVGEIVSKNLSDSQLEKLVGKEEVQREGDEKFNELLGKYNISRMYKSIKKKLFEGVDESASDDEGRKKNNKKVKSNFAKLSEQERHVALQVAGKGAEARAREMFKNYSIQVKEAFANSYADAASRGLFTAEDLAIGIKAEAKSADEGYKKYEKENKEKGLTIRDYVGSSMKKILEKDVNSEQFSRGAEMFYQAISSK